MDFYKSLRNSNMADTFSEASVETLDVWPTVLSFVSISAGILIVYSPQLPHHDFR